jgi:phage FluMu protein Com
MIYLAKEPIKAGDKITVDEVRNHKGIVYSMVRLAKPDDKPIFVSAKDTATECVITRITGWMQEYRCTKCGKLLFKHCITPDDNQIGYIDIHCSRCQESNVVDF